eukprot:2503404-Rhodomonas_salina.1
MAPSATAKTCSVCSLLLAMWSARVMRLILSFWAQAAAMVCVGGRDGLRASQSVGFFYSGIYPTDNGFIQQTPSITPNATDPESNCMGSRAKGCGYMR